MFPTFVFLRVNTFPKKRKKKKKDASSAGENKRHFQGECFSKTTITGPPSNKFRKHTGYTVDINLMSFLTVQAFRLHAEKGGTRKNP